MVRVTQLYQLSQHYQIITPTQREGPNLARFGGPHADPAKHFVAAAGEI